MFLCDGGCKFHNLFSQDCLKLLYNGNNCEVIKFVKKTTDFDTCDLYLRGKLALSFGARRTVFMSEESNCMVRI